MKKFRTVIATLIALFFYTVTDILIWQRIFEANNMVGYANLYHTGWFVTLAGYAVMGTILLWGSWKDCLYFVTSLFVAAFSGLEDVLYYALDRKPMPEALPWLDGNPMIYISTREGVIFSVILDFRSRRALFLSIPLANPGYTDRCQINYQIVPGKYRMSVIRDMRYFLPGICLH